MRYRVGSAHGRALDGSTVRTVWHWEEPRGWLVLVSVDDGPEHELSCSAIWLDLDSAGDTVAIWLGDSLVTFPTEHISMIMDCVGIRAHEAGHYDIPDDGSTQ